MLSGYGENLVVLGPYENYNLSLFTVLHCFLNELFKQIEASKC